MGRSWPLTGRAEELRFIDAAIRRSRGPRGVVLAGVAGVGKTRLAREALASAEQRGVATRWATGTASARALPLGSAGLTRSGRRRRVATLPEPGRSMLRYCDSGWATSMCSRCDSGATCMRRRESHSIGVTRALTRPAPRSCTESRCWGTRRWPLFVRTATPSASSPGHVDDNRPFLVAIFS
jgi:hypothetical protein